MNVEQLGYLIVERLVQNRTDTLKGLRFGTICVDVLGEKVVITDTNNKGLRIEFYMEDDKVHIIFSPGVDLTYDELTGQTFH